MKEAEDKALKELKESRKKKKGDDKLNMLPDLRRKQMDMMLVFQSDMTHVRRGKVFHYGGNPDSSSGRIGLITFMWTLTLPTLMYLVMMTSLVDWDERSEIENGFGPKATWTKDKGYDF